MTNRTPIRDYSHRIIGYIDDDPIKDMQIGRDYYQRIVGYYDKKRDLTTDYYHRVISKGNSLSSLIWNAHYQYLSQQQKPKP